MTEQNKAVKKMAQRVLDGYEYVHEKKYDKAKQYLEPILPFFHQEDRPNITFLSYLAIAQIGSTDVDQFLQTYEELQRYETNSPKEEALKKRVDSMFTELMESLNKNI